MYNRPKNLYIYRGLPGSGKSTEASKIGCIIFEPEDHWMYHNKKYLFAHIEVPVAREKALRVVNLLMKEEYDIALADVFPRLSDLVPYLELAKAHGYTIEVKDLLITKEQSIQRNRHSVLVQDIEWMAQVWEDWNLAAASSLLNSNRK